MPKSERGFIPILAPVLQSRKTAAVLAFIAAIQLGTTMMGWVVWPCPFYRVTGIPCPGCGLSRGCAALLRGQWHTAIKLHAFSPLLLAGIFLVALGAALPPGIVRPIATTIARLERTTGAFGVILALAIVCWIIVLTKMFPAGGVVKGILGIICALYALIWGYQHKDEQGIASVVQAWLGLIVVGIVVQVLTAVLVHR